MSFDVHFFIDRNGKRRASITAHDGTRSRSVEITPDEFRALASIAIRAVGAGDVAGGKGSP
jgi:prolyl-tRNA editing enzyme YbaK/EbsC (Cys-tRNA(Pro) deacylase)